MIPCQLSTISEFICSAFQFRVILSQNKSWNAWKIANEVRKGLKSDDVALNGACWMQKKSWVKICLKNSNPFIIDEYSSETLILRKRLSSFSCNPLNFLAHAMWVKWWNRANFQPFLIVNCTAFQFQGHLAQKKSINVWKIANEVRKGWKLMTWLRMVHTEHTKSLELK